MPDPAIFFYGLFMDRARLVAMGLSPQGVGPAALHGYRIHVGERASLLRSPGSRALGIVMRLSAAEAEQLYSAPSVREYVPEEVELQCLDDGRVMRALCYNLPPALARAGSNPDYARELSRLVRELGLDPGYANEIAAFATGP